MTLKVHEDNSLVREVLDQPGEGRVLVVDGGGSLRCALLGDNLARMGAANGWVEIGKLPLGVKALATHPAKSVKRGEGQADLELRFADTSFTPGAWLYADEDGMVVASGELAA
jgi:regulator of ribonuclease activity A